MTVATWTIVSRVTGLARFAAIGAVLGPTFFGNTYQFTNSLPNLVYYGFLAGSLFSSLLVPALVRHIDAGDRRAQERVAGGFLGMTLAALLVITPVAVLLGPLVLGVAALSGGAHLETAAQVSVARLLLLMFIPQIYCYGVVGTATAVMNAHQRFALAAAAPAVENVGTIVVLAATGVIYGTGTSLTHVPTGELLLLGFGSTGAVVLHAATQWWGARRVGVVLVPRPGWRDREVRVVVRRAIPSLGQAGLYALQVLALLAAANQLPGGIVAFQIALNFYYLANSLGTEPVALSVLPRLARIHLEGNAPAFRDTLVRGLALGWFVTIPAAVGYLVLAHPFAQAISFGRMDSPAGVTMVAASLASLSLAIVGQTGLLIAIYASYARKDTRTPLISVLLGTVALFGVAGTTLLLHGPAVLFVLGLAMCASVSVAGIHLTTRLRRDFHGQGSQRLAPSLARFIAGAAVMAGPAWITATVISKWLGPPLGPRIGILAAALVGIGVYVAFQVLCRTEEVSWLAAGFGHMRGKARLALAGLTMAAGPPGALPRRGRGPPTGWLLVAGLLVAAGAGAASTLGPIKAVLGLLVVLLVAAVWKWPALAAYLVIGVTPLSVGVSKGLPLIRPNELVDLLVGGALAARGIVALRTGRLPRIRLDAVEIALVLMAVCASVIPLLWMMLRQAPITTDDLLYSLVLWKLLGIYAIIRFSVTTDQQVRRCLWISVGVACVVALIAILQSLNLFGVQGLLNNYFAYSGNGPGTAGARGSSTLGLPAATADLTTFNLAIVAGMWARGSRHRLILGGAATLLFFGALSAGEFSGALGLLLGLLCIALVTNSRRLLLLFIPVGLIGSSVLWPVIKGRLSGFHSGYGLPQSWIDRLANLRTFFWPKLFSDWNWVLGVRPSARIPVLTQSAGYVWIESGYTWLLWGGGILLLGSFIFFAVAAARRGWLAARHGPAGASAAGTAAFVAVIVTTVLMVFDPHLTFRGSGDALFMLIALAAPRAAHSARRYTRAQWNAEHFPGPGGRPAPTAPPKYLDDARHGTAMEVQS
jgi:putative peptidoglycan lipid II flippase